MSQITLRKIPENIEKQIRALSKKSNSSLNSTIIELLEKALGTGRKTRNKRDLSKLVGTWNREQAKEFEENTRIFEQIDEEIWRQ